MVVPTENGVAVVVTPVPENSVVVTEQNKEQMFLHILVNIGNIVKNKSKKWEFSLLLISTKMYISLTNEFFMNDIDTTSFWA